MHSGSALTPALRAFLASLAASDPRAAVGGASALAVHLGREPAAPVVVLVRRMRRVPLALRAALRLRRGSVAEPERRDGVAIEPRLEALLRVLSGPGREHDAELLAASAAALGAEDRVQLFRRASRTGCAPGLARAAWLVARIEGRGLRLRPAGAPILLRPGAPALGPIDRSAGLRINAPPGVPLGSEERDALARALLRGLEGSERVLLALAAAGLPLDPRLAAEALGRGPWAERIDALVEAGRLGAGGRALAPLDHPDRVPLSAPLLRRALETLEASREGSRRAAAVDLRIRLGDPSAANAALVEAPGALERGELSRVEGWLAALEPREPARMRSLRARVLERGGRLTEALEVVRAALVDAAPEARPALLLDRARLSWRAGRIHEASAALRALDRATRQARGTAERVEAQLLRASIALERGEAAEARAHLGRARGSAEESGDDESLARVLRRLGTLEARAGRPGAAGGAYRAALVALRRARSVRDPALEATLLANLATTESWLGRHAEAEALYGEALARRAGQPLEALNTKAALALLVASRGERPPGGAFGPLSDEAEHLGEPRLRAELAVYRAEELAIEGRLGEAEEMLARARTALAELGGAEVVLEAMSEAADGMVRARRGERAAAPVLARAIDRLVGAGARYHAARTAREAAAATLWLGDEDAALAHVERAAQLGDEAGIVLGLDRTHAVPLVLAALGGSLRAQAHASAALERAGDMRVAAWLRGAGRADLAARWLGRAQGTRPGAPYHALGPDGAHALFEAGRSALLARGDVVVLDRVEHRLHVPGRAPRRLDRMRAVEPLLALLAARRPEPVSLEELARQVWGQRPGRSVVAAITTSIARLRRLIGHHDVLRTVGSGTARAYAVPAAAPLYAIERRLGG